MKHASDEPSTLTGKRARPRSFTMQQVLDKVTNSDSGKFDQEYFSESRNTSDEYIDEGESDDASGPR